MSDFIPKRNAEFYSWQNTLVNDIVINAPAWNIPAARVTSLQTAQSAYLTAYSVASDPATKTKAANQAHDEKRELYKTEIRSFVSAYVRSNPDITNQQRTEMGLPLPDTTPSERPAINTQPTVRIITLGGGKMIIECRREGDETRPSVHPDADGVEFRGARGGTQPANYKQATEVFFSSRARTELTLNADDIGQRIWVFARWKNNSDDNKSGPWTTDPATELLR